MALALLLLAAGGAVLHVGAGLARRGISRAGGAAPPGAAALGPVLGGIHLPALAVALAAAGRGHTEAAAGSAFGAALFLLTVALGSALLAERRPVAAPRGALTLLAPAGAVILAALAVAGRFVARLEGVLLILGYAGYVFLEMRDRALLELPERHVPDDPGEEAPDVPVEEADVGVSLRVAGGAVLGALLLLAGAWLAVEGGARLSASTGLAPGFVGAGVLGTLAAVDRALPSRREVSADLLLATVTALLTVALGLAALVRPLILDTGGNLAFLAVALIAAPLSIALIVRERLGWRTGVVLIAAYVAWLVYAGGAS